MTITEKCSCGATFTVSDRYPSAAQEAAKSWRQDHQHADAVGICADRPQPLVLGDTEIQRMPCVLKAGHTGAHGDGQGDNWLYAQPDHDLTRGNR